MSVSRWARVGLTVGMQACGASKLVFASRPKPGSLYWAGRESDVHAAAEAVSFIGKRGAFQISHLFVLSVCTVWPLRLRGGASAAAEGACVASGAAAARGAPLLLFRLARIQARTSAGDSDSG